MPCRQSIIALLVASSAFAQTANRSVDEGLLHSQNLPTKGLKLLQILRDRTPSDAIVQQFNDHVARLRMARYGTRQHATADLMKMGPVVRPLLERYLAEQKPDPETAARLRHVLEQFPADKDHAIISAAARLIARDRPANSLAVLFDFVPHATDEMVRQEIQRTIDALAIADKKPAPIVLATLNDANAARSAAAGESLVRNLGLAAKSDLSKLLADPAPVVRYQLGKALVERHDKSGLPLLIQAITDGPRDRAEQALDLLHRVAGESAPEVVYHGKSNAVACAAAWLAWHEKHDPMLDLAQALNRPELGLTLISSTGIKVNTKNRIFELGPDKKTVRWEFDGPRYPMDARIVGNNRVLLAEYYDRQVTERDFKGQVLWQVFVAMPVACQRLPNGHTFIASRQQLLIVDREGTPTFTWASPNLSISTACRLDNGQIAVVTTGGRCQLLDATGRELKSFQLGQVYSMGGSIEVLPSGRVLAPLYTQSTVAEFDWDGTRRWNVSIARPISATRLKNGNTLVTCSIDYRVVEFDPSGREVWTLQTEGRPFRARRR